MIPLVLDHSADTATVTTANLFENKKQQTVVTQRRERFEKSGNLYYSDNVRKCRQECKKTWYRKRDYESMRSDIACAVHKAKRIIQKEERFDEQYSFHKVMESLIKLTSEVNYVLDDASVLLLENSNKHQQLLSHLYRQDVARLEWLGLELRRSSSLSEESLHRRTSIQSVVHDVQFEYRQGLWSTAEVDVEWRDPSRNYPQAMTLMAQFLIPSFRFGGGMSNDGVRAMLVFVPFEEEC
ncbi:hypothetical protein ACA910_009556 [Epithemia clementina (nom. ined.)]